jgi:putative dimethyl sulfoxide reductase chaperone
MTEEITFEDILAGRVATYGMLARLYRKEVDQSFLDEMRAMRYPQNTGNENVDTGYRMFHHYLCNVWERTLSELAIDYARVFLGSGMNSYSAAYPIESVHTSPRRLLMQDSRDEVLAIYRSAGIVKSDTWREGEDHIAVELEFMQILSQRAIEALADDDEDKAVNILMTSYNFLMDHLFNWVPMLVTEMQKFSATEFYQALAYLTMGFIETDREFLEDVLEDELSKEEDAEGEALVIDENDLEV